MTTVSTIRADRARQLASARRARLDRRPAPTGPGTPPAHPGPDPTPVPGSIAATAPGPVASPRSSRAARLATAIETAPIPLRTRTADRMLGLTRRLLDAALLAIIALGLASVVLGRILPALGHPVLIVAGPSMTPTIPLGSAVILSQVEPGDLRVGDVASLRTGPAQAIFTHRVTRFVDHDGATWIETRGDANDGVDPSLTPVAAVIGRVDAWLPGAGYLLTLVSSPVGVLFALSVGALLLVGGWLLDDLAAARRRRRLAAATPVIRGRRRMDERPRVAAG